MILKLRVVCTYFYAANASSTGRAGRARAPASTRSRASSSRAPAGAPRRRRSSRSRGRAPPAVGFMSGAEGGRKLDAEERTLRPATQASADSRDSARAAVRSTSQHGSSRRGRRRSRGDEVCLAGPLITAARPRASRAARETMLAFERVLLTWLSRGAVASYNRASRRYNDIQSERRR